MQLRSTGLLVLLSVAGSTPAAAQFVTPLPAPLAGEEVKRSVIYSAIRDTLGSLALDHASTDTSELLVKALEKVRDSTCERVYNPGRSREGEAAVAKETCVASVDSVRLKEIADSALDIVGELDEDTAKTIQAIKKMSPSVLEYPGMLPVKRSDLMPYFRRIDFESLDLLRQFSAQIKEGYAFVLTETLSGSIGFLLFGVTYAGVAIDESARQFGDSVVVDVSADTVSQITSSVSRLINNGGSISARFQYPLFAGGGTNVQHGSSIYTQFGLLGPVGTTDSLKASGAIVAEYVAAATVRAFTVSDQPVAQVIMAGRLGWAWSESRIARNVPDVPADIDAAATFFVQFGVGVARLGGTGFALSALVTPPWMFDDGLEEFMPRAVINLSFSR